MKKKKVFLGIISSILILAILYSVAVFSDIPFIKKWRTIYIETAMTTMTHQWLATSFIPGHIVDEVMQDASKQQEIQQNIESNWGTTTDIEVTIKDDILISNPEETKENVGLDSIPNIGEENEKQKQEQLLKEAQKEKFFELYWEVDRDSIEQYMSANPEATYDTLLIENLDESIDIKTTFGETIKVLDVKNNLIIVKVTGEGYSGLLAKSKDPAQITVAKSTTLGSAGNLIGKFSKDNNALVAINASGFADENWQGNGGTITGSMIIDGKDYGNPISWMKLFGFKEDNRMYIENYRQDRVSQFKWGIQFSPALIVDGEVFVQGSFGYGLQPRSAVGQTETGEFLMLVIDGRQPLHSVGATVGDLSEIMLRHKTYQAMNLDGGSSSVMTYKGETINSPSSKTKAGRYLPNAFIMKYAEDITSNG